MLSLPSTKKKKEEGSLLIGGKRKGTILYTENRRQTKKILIQIPILERKANLVQAKEKIFLLPWEMVE